MALSVNPDCHVLKFPGSNIAFHRLLFLSLLRGIVVIANMYWLGALFFAVAVDAQGFSNTMLRFGCSQAVIDRIDP